MWEDLKGLTASFYGCEKDKKTFWFSDLFIFKRRLRRGHLCCQKWFVKGSGSGPGAEPFPYKMLFSTPYPLRYNCLFSLKVEHEIKNSDGQMWAAIRMCANESTLKVFTDTALACSCFHYASNQKKFLQLKTVQEERNCSRRASPNLTGTRPDRHWKFLRNCTWNGKNYLWHILCLVGILKTEYRLISFKKTFYTANSF